MSKNSTAWYVLVMFCATSLYAIFVMRSTVSIEEMITQAVVIILAFGTVTAIAILRYIQSCHDKVMAELDSSNKSAKR